MECNLATEGISSINTGGSPKSVQYFNMAIFVKVFLSWFHYAEEKRKKKEAINEALDRRRQWLHKVAVTQWIKVCYFVKKTLQSENTKYGFNTAFLFSSSSQRIPLLNEKGLQLVDMFR